MCSAIHESRYAEREGGEKNCVELEVYRSWSETVRYNNINIYDCLFNRLQFSGIDGWLQKMMFDKSMEKSRRTSQIRHDEEEKKGEEPTITTTTKQLWLYNLLSNHSTHWHSQHPTAKQHKLVPLMIVDVVNSFCFSFFFQYELWVT